MRASSLLYAGLGMSVIVIGFAFYSNMEKKTAAPELVASSIQPFMTACVDPVLAGNDNVGEACRSLTAINETYDVDIASHIARKHQLMQKTARRIVEGDLSKPQDYKQCIADGACADVPLLPANVDPEKMTAAQRTTSEIFWDLAEQEKMTPAVCHIIPECRAMTKLKVIDYGF